MGLFEKIFGDDEIRNDRGHDRSRDEEIRVATAALLVEIGEVDGRFSEAERARVLGILKERFGLTDAHARALTRAARKELDESLDLWLFTNIINENVSTEEKAEIVRHVWRVIYADGRLEAHEDYLVHQIANLLHVDHSRLMEAKLDVLRESNSE